MGKNYPKIPSNVTVQKQPRISAGTAPSEDKNLSFRFSHLDKDFSFGKPSHDDIIKKILPKFRLLDSWKKRLYGFQSPDDAGASIL